MFDMTVSVNVGRKANANKNSTEVYVNEDGQTKDAWFKEEDIMRKKLDKQAINQLKNRIAQSNR